MPATDTIDPAPHQTPTVPTAVSAHHEKASSRLPITCALIGLIAAVFAAEILFGIGDWTKLLEPSLRTLVAFGGLQYPLVVDNGEWFRLFSAPLLHVDLTHVALNLVALYFAGRALEPMVGPYWFGALFVTGGVGGGLLSLAVNAHDLVSVGASGAIMALFAAIFVLSFHEPDKIARNALRARAVGILIPSLLPFAGVTQGTMQGTTQGTIIDYGAHFGGAIAGVLLSLAMLAFWKNGESRPRFKPVATAIMLAGLMGVGFGAFANARQYEGYDLGQYLIPNDQLPEGRDVVTRAADLLKTYPHDPRAHLYQAIADVHANNLAAAENQMYAALTEEQATHPVLQPGLRTHLQSYLALILSDQNRFDEARDVARAGCADKSATLHDALVESRLCKPYRP